MRKHLIIAALAAAAFVTGCKSYDTDPNRNAPAQDTNDFKARNSPEFNDERIGNDRTESSDVNDDQAGTGGSGSAVDTSGGARGGSGSNDVSGSDESSVRTGEDLDSPTRRNGHVDDKTSEGDGKLQIILK